jgi:hypothetical protein
MPEPQTLLMVVASTDLGRPAPRAAWRAGAWPSRREDAAHENLVDLIARDAGALHRGLDRGGAELGRGGAGELALERAHRGAGVGEDDDGVVGGAIMRAPKRSSSAASTSLRRPLRMSGILTTFPSHPEERLMLGEACLEGTHGSLLRVPGEDLVRTNKAHRRTMFKSSGRGLGLRSCVSPLSSLRRLPLAAFGGGGIAGLCPYTAASWRAQVAGGGPAAASSSRGPRAGGGGICRCCRRPIIPQERLIG